MTSDRRHWKYLWLLVFLLAVFIATVACNSKEKGAEKKGAAPTAAAPPAVVVAPVLQKSVPVYGEYVARTEARESVEIRARVDGFLDKVSFKEGGEVKAGQTLFVIDQRPYKAALLEAKASQAQAEAALGKSRKDVDRLRPLVGADAAPKQDLDKAESEVQYNQASVEKAKADVTTAELNLQFTEIQSPITGIIGKEEVTVGNLISQDKTLLAVVSSWDPMRVVFSISESDYLLLSKESRDRTNAPQKRLFELIMADNSIYPHPGEVSFVDRFLDLTTGTLKIYVNFPNPDKLLRPGLFGRIRVVLEEAPNALLVPQRAVQEMQGVKTVLVVGQDNSVSLRTVAIGWRYEDYFTVTEGLKAGEKIVVEGVQKAIPGQKVTPMDRPVTEQKGKE
ncbi:MAG: efflux RND transporter periplasmic adaptor subunit [Syntrophobacteraceae bacterium]